MDEIPRSFPSRIRCHFSSQDVTFNGFRHPIIRVRCHDDIGRSFGQWTAITCGAQTAEFDPWTFRKYPTPSQHTQPAFEHGVP